MTTGANEQSPERPTSMKTSSGSESGENRFARAWMSGGWRRRAADQADTTLTAVSKTDVTTPNRPLALRPGQNWLDLAVRS